MARETRNAVLYQPLLRRGDLGSATQKSTALQASYEVLQRYEQNNAELYRSAQRPNGSFTPREGKSVSTKLREGRLGESNLLRDLSYRPAHTDETRPSHMGAAPKVAYAVECGGIEHGDESIEAVRVACERDGIRRINEMQRRIEEDALLRRGVRRSAEEMSSLRGIYHPWNNSSAAKRC